MNDHADPRLEELQALHSELVRMLDGLETTGRPGVGEAERIRASSSQLATRFARLRQLDARLGPPADERARAELAEAYGRVQRMHSVALDLATRAAARSGVSLDGVRGALRAVRAGSKPPSTGRSCDVSG